MSIYNKMNTHILYWRIESAELVVFCALVRPCSAKDACEYATKCMLKETFSMRRFVRITRQIFNQWRTLWCVSTTKVSLSVCLPPSIRMSLVLLSLCVHVELFSLVVPRLLVGFYSRNFGRQCVSIECMNACDEFCVSSKDDDDGGTISVRILCVRQVCVRQSNANNIFLFFHRLFPPTTIHSIHKIPTRTHAHTISFSIDSQQNQMIAQSIHIKMIEYSRFSALP